MVEQRSFEAFYAATYRPLVVQPLGVTGNLADLPVQEIAAERAGTVVHPGQRVRAVGCPPGGQVWFEDGTALRARQDGSFTTSFEIPPGPTGDFFLDATCGGVTREVKLRREP